jgi:Domain of unknown function (DUF6379)
MFPSRLIEDDSLRTSAEGFSFDIRLPWYRALPVSSFEDMRITIDDEPIDLADVAVSVGGRKDQFTNLAARYDDWWYVLDPARVDVKRPGGINAAEHNLTLVLAIRIPYIVIPTGVLVLNERCSKSLKAVEQVAR